MISELKPLAHQFGVNSWLFNSTFKDLSAEQVAIRPRDRGNSILWTAGHIVSSRYFLANLLGIEDKQDWTELFGRGQDVLDDSKYPSIDEIKAAFDDISGKLTARFEAITEAELKAEHGIEFPIEDKTLTGAITFMSLHDSYHMGQFSYIRKLLGLEGLTG